MQLDGREYAKIAMLQCIAHEAAGVRTNWYMLHCRIFVKGVLGEIID
jgi:hypothetical protein